VRESSDPLLESTQATLSWLSSGGSCNASSMVASLEMLNNNCAPSSSSGDEELLIEADVLVMGKYGGSVIAAVDGQTMYTDRLSGKGVVGWVV
jgi:hypothetical protein